LYAMSLHVTPGSTEHGESERNFQSFRIPLTPPPPWFYHDWLISTLLHQYTFGNVIPRCTARSRRGPGGCFQVVYHSLAPCILSTGTVTVARVGRGPRSWGRFGIAGSRTRAGRGECSDNLVSQCCPGQLRQCRVTPPPPPATCHIVACSCGGVASLGATSVSGVASESRVTSSSSSRPGVTHCQPK
jgi:hypothetical protein